MLIGEVKPTAAAAVADLLAQVATRERNIEGLASRANTDPLTGINNRRGLTKKMSETDSAVYTVVLIDLDHFKSYNDTYGHIAGDHVLQAAAGVLAAGMRTRDLVSRYGGEEFCMAIDGPASAALAIVDRIREAWDAVDRAARHLLGRRRRAAHQRGVDPRPGPGRCGALRGQGTRPQPHPPVDRSGRPLNREQQRPQRSHQAVELDTPCCGQPRRAARPFTRNRPLPPPWSDGPGAP